MVVPVPPVPDAVDVPPDIGQRLLVVRAGLLALPDTRCAQAVAAGVEPACLLVVEGEVGRMLCVEQQAVVRGH